MILFATSLVHWFPALTQLRPGDPPWQHPIGWSCRWPTLVIGVVPYVSRIMRARLIEVLESDYVEMARLKGMPERTVLWRHAIPNAIGPASR